MTYYQQYIPALREPPQGVITLLIDTPDAEWSLQYLLDNGIVICDHIYIATAATRSNIDPALWQITLQLRS